MVITEEQTPKKKIKFPKAVIFIVSMAFFEKVSYAGIRTMLSLYLKNKLDFSDDTTTAVYHIFVSLTFFFPLFGAILADSVFGKFKTILYFSIVYAFGQLLIATGAVPTFGLPVKVVSMIGLFFVVLGAGGIRPCVSALGGDQFVLPQQEKYLTSYFSVFYFTTNMAALISSFTVPQLRNSIGCFGEPECYSIAFLVPATLLILGIGVFLMAKPLYMVRRPERNIIVDVTKCISHAIYRKLTEQRRVARKHWLDYAEDEYDSNLIEDIKMTVKASKVFLACPFFWMLVDQQGSRWTLQATRMDGQIGSFRIKADQMQVLYPLFIILFIPLLDAGIYPVMDKFKFLDKPLHRMTTGGFLGVLAFIFVGALELQMEKTYPVLPISGHAQLRIFNPNDCYLPLVIDNRSILMEPLDMWMDQDMAIAGTQNIPYTANFSLCGGPSTMDGFINVAEEQATSFVMQELHSYAYNETINRTKSGNPAVRLLTHTTSPDVVTKVQLSDVDYVFETSRSLVPAAQVSQYREFPPGTYMVKVNGKIIRSITLALGGVYTLQTYVTENSTKMNLTTVTPPNSVHIMWLLPQYATIGIAEVMFGVTGFQFAFTQAPTTMKTILQAAWLFAIAISNFIVVVITQAKLFERQASEFFFYASLTAVVMLIFALMTRSYEYHGKNIQDEVGERDDTDVPLTGRSADLQESLADDETRLWNFHQKISG